MSSRGYAEKSGGKDNEALSRLKNQLKSKAPARVYLFHGNEPFLIDFYVNELKRLILSSDPGGLNLTRFEGRINVNDLMDACDTFPVFAERKLVLVKDSGLFFGKAKKDASSPESGEDDSGGNDGASPAEKNEGEDAGNKAQEALKGYLPEMPETTCLIFIESQVDKRLGVYKQLSKCGLAVELNRLKPDELAAWAIKAFQRSGKAISPDTAQYLVAISETDMYSLKNEILKLIAYAGERRDVTLEDVRLMATPTVKSVIFDLLDAVAQKNSAGSLKLLDDMLEIKEPEQKILTMLSRQTGEMLKIKLLQKNGVPSGQMSRYFPGKHPYALKMLQAQAERMDEKYLKKFLKCCMEADSRYKKGLMPPRLSLEYLLGKINS